MQFFYYARLMFALSSFLYAIINGMNKLELLAPAGNMEAALQAIHNGADAIYMGGKSFGARAFAGNFSYDEMKEAIDTAHLYGVKVYVTVNTLIFQDEVKDFIEHAGRIYKLGADALIMQDVGMINMVRSMYPDVELHASTQMHNHNDSCLHFLKSLGMKRAVLAREKSIEQIKNFTCTIDKEAFIHGALCISYSGQCLFSSLTLGRSGNRGTCAQVCRMKYSLEDEDGNQIAKEGEYLISPRDFALFEDIDKLIEAGVTSYKIEGRMKAPQYVGHITKIYSQLLNDYKYGAYMKVNGADIQSAKKLFNRGFTKGHLLGDTGSRLMSVQRPNHRGISIGQVISISRDKITLKLSDELNQGDGIKFETSDTGFICNKIYLKGKLVNGAKNGDIIELDAKAQVQAGETVLKTSDVILLKSLDSYAEKKIAVTGHIEAHAGKPLLISLCDNDGHSVSASGDIVQPGKTRPTTRQELIESTSKLGGTPFILERVTADCDEDIFIARSQVNSLRRNAAEKLVAERTKAGEKRIFEFNPEPVSHNQNDSGTTLHVLVRNAEQFVAVKDIVSGDIYTSDVNLYFDNKDKYINLRLKTDKLAEYPPVYKNERLLVTDNGGIYDYSDCNDIVLDYSLNAVNAESVSFFVKMNAKRITLSPELSISQTSGLIKAYEIRNSQKPPLEALIYARHELMAMKHCIISDNGKTNGKCVKCEKKQYYLTDINENRYPIVTDDNCNNYILGQKFESREIAALKALGVIHFRIEFFDEDAELCQKVIKEYINKLYF